MCIALHWELYFSTNKYSEGIVRLKYMWYYIHKCLIYTVTGLKALVILTLTTLEETCNWIWSCPE